MSVEHDELEFIAGLIKRRSGMVITPEKKYLVESRLGKVAKDRGIESMQVLFAELAAKSGELEESVVDALTINETSFFRDSEPFDVLAQQMLPEVIEQKRASRSLNIWCAAASTGQEPYTIAMTIRRHFPELADWRIRFVASDISDRVLDKAREGVYSQLEVNRGMPEKLLRDYFEPTDDGWKVTKDLRRMVDFRKVNLIGDWGDLANLDVVFIRNVLIYFDVETKRKILGRIHERMAPHGFLMLGGAESTMNLNDSFERLKGARCSAYRLKAE